MANDIFVALCFSHHINSESVEADNALPSSIIWIRLIFIRMLNFAHVAVHVADNMRIILTTCAGERQAAYGRATQRPSPSATRCPCRAVTAHLVGTLDK